MKSGIGTASLEIGAGVIVGAIAAVNAFVTEAKRKFVRPSMRRMVRRSVTPKPRS